MTTLRVYAAWLAVADQRASVSLAQRGHVLPAQPANEAERALQRPRSPRERLAVELRQKILDGDYAAGAHLPGVKELGFERGLPPSTVGRAYELLRQWGLLVDREGERPHVRSKVTADAAPVDVEEPSAGRPLCRLVIRRRSDVVARLMAEVDPTDPRALRRLLLDSIRRRGEDGVAVRDYEMQLQDATSDDLAGRSS